MMPTKLYLEVDMDLFDDNTHLVYHIVNRHYWKEKKYREDIIQEGMIGLYKAAKTYNENKCSAFVPFAELCICAEINTFLKKQFRQQYYAMSDICDSTTDEHQEIDVVDDKHNEDHAANTYFNLVTQSFSTIEKVVLKFLFDGYTKKDLAERLQVKIKDINKILKIIRRKYEIQEIPKQKSSSEKHS